MADASKNCSAVDDDRSEGPRISPNLNEVANVLDGCLSEILRV